jgi:signal transduction histidine kinase
MSSTDDDSIGSMLRFGLSRAIQIHSEEVRSRFPRLLLELDLIDDEHLLTEKTCLALFRIYLEAVNNIERHMDEITGPSGQQPVWIRNYLLDSEMVLEIRDEGDSFSIPGDWAKFTRSRGGVMGMKPRIEELGGTLHVTTEPGPGTLIQAKVPLTE